MKLIRPLETGFKWVLVEAPKTNFLYFKDLTIEEYKSLLRKEYVEVMPHGVYELEDWKIDRECLRNGHDLYLKTSDIKDKRCIKVDTCLSRLFKSISQGHTKIENNHITVKGIFRKNGRVICLYPLINEDLNNG
ncbi:hypothetical protein [Proteus phage PM2]|uniref:Uncharacterized protein n=1 Tax=Proteus phage PM2 TaxID=2025809 RepID=A0A249XWY8_9CAUD|nr:hypothetical protein KNT71_gp137 [Proteus phage PM2]ASZ76495.1 hypothetical protein [Proteus phage PM2]